MAMLKQAQQSSAPESPEEDAQDTQAEASPGDTQQDATGAPAEDSASPSDTGTVGSSPDDSSGSDDEEGTSEEQKQMDSYIGALYTVLYSNEGTSRAFLDQLKPENKVDSVTKACVLLIRQLDEKLNFNTDLIPSFTIVVVDQATDIADRVKQFGFTDKELQAVLGATYESVLHIFGISPQAAQQKLSTIPAADQEKAKTEYGQFLNSATTDQPPLDSGGAQPGPSDQAAPAPEGGPPMQGAMPPQGMPTPAAGGPMNG